MRCRGFVLDRHKLVYMPEHDETWVFDLDADPDEREPIVPGANLLQHVGRLHNLIDSHRTSEWRMVYAEVSYGDWLCPEGVEQCRHPQATDVRYRRNKAEEGKRAFDSVGAEACGHLGFSWQESPDSTATVVKCKTNGLW